MSSFALPLLLTVMSAAPVTAEDYARAYSLEQELRGTVFRSGVDAHWLSDNHRFWYRNDLPGDRREFILVDAQKAERVPAFDHKRLAKQLSDAAGKPYQAERLPLDRLEFDAGEMSFSIGRTRWKCDLESYELEKVESPPRQSRRNRRSSPRRSNNAGDSPDGKLRVFVRNHNLYLRDNADGEEFPLTSDGTQDHGYGAFSWSPDSKTIVAHRIRPGETNTVHLLESSKSETFKSQLRSRHYAQPGTRFSSYQMVLFDAQSRERKSVQVEPVDFRGPPRPRWKADGSAFTYRKLDRGFQRYRIIEVNPATGEARHIVDEHPQTFVDSTRIYVHHLDKTNELIFASERDGWRHLYLIDAATGTVKQQITQGEWVVRGVEQVDADARQILFTASGRNPGEDPYHVHYYRINFDGSGLTALTEGNGTHRGKFSPDRKYLIDTWSRVDQAPVTELRDAETGKLLVTLEEADTARLKATGCPLPEAFHTTGRDDKTEIYGVVFRPRNLDPGAKYPVVENIYAGPHNSHVRKSFRTYDAMQALAELGFIVVQIDGMGTANRGKKFHDVCWQNLGDAGFPDRIRWIRALAEKYSYVDATRVGIYGTSAGGYDSTRALLAHPDFYHVAVSSCGNHDHRIDKQWWNEQWMGYPVGKHYHEQSNITNAGKLRGKLLLMVGEMDTNVPPESSIRLADALIKAGKEFELLMLPGVGHSSGGSYGNRKRWDFFVRHLLGAQPPNWNVVDWQKTRRARPAQQVAAAENPEAEKTKDAGEKKRPKVVAASEHQSQDVEGWTVQVDKRLLTAEHAELGKQALRALRGELIELSLIVPADKVKRMREVTIWMDLENPTLGSLQYHPSAGWLRDNGHDVKLARGVHIPHAKRLLNLATSNHQPAVMLHELAHAYHDQVLNFDQTAIRQAYEKIKESGKYEKVLHISGRQVKHYALTNHKEFFAEFTECYFHTNDFYPFVRPELKQAEPEIYRLLEEIWGKVK